MNTELSEVKNRHTSRKTWNDIKKTLRFKPPGMLQTIKSF